jgi:hypothetical protein
MYEHVPEVVDSAGFQHQDAMLGILAETVRQTAASRAAADDDEVKRIVPHGPQ